MKINSNSLGPIDPGDKPEHVEIAKSNPNPIRETTQNVGDNQIFKDLIGRSLLLPKEHNGSNKGELGQLLGSLEYANPDTVAVYTSVLREANLDTVKTLVLGNPDMSLAGQFFSLASSIARLSTKQGV